MKKRLIAVLLSCSKLFSTLVATASAYTKLSTVKHSAAETHWNIFEEGYETPDGAAINKYSSGNSILVKSLFSFLTRGRFFVRRRQFFAYVL